MQSLSSEPFACVSRELGTDNMLMEYLMTFNPMEVDSDIWRVDNIASSKSDKVFYGHETEL